MVKYILLILPFTLYAGDTADLLVDENQLICKIEQIVPKDIFNFEKYFEEELARALAVYGNEEPFFMGENEEADNDDFDPAYCGEENSALEMVQLVKESDSTIFSYEKNEEFHPSLEAVPQRGGQLAARPKVTSTNENEKGGAKKQNPVVSKKNALSKAAAKNVKGNKNIVKRGQIQNKKKSASKRPTIEVDNSEE